MADINLMLYRAAGIGSITPPTLHIFVTAEVPEPKSLVDARKAYKEQAKKLADALFASLPGGTIDALLVEMMSRKVSLFTVPHG